MVPDTRLTLADSYSDFVAKETVSAATEDSGQLFSVRHYELEGRAMVANVDEIEGCKDEQVELGLLQERATAMGRELEQEGKRLQDEQEGGDDLSIKGHIEWRRTDVSFDVPELYWDRKTISYDMVKTYRKRQNIKFDVPHITWELKTIGHYPKCNGLRCRKEPIRTKVPVLSKKRVDISFDIPEFKWDRTEMKFDVPKFRQKRIEWKFDLPYFIVDEVAINEKIHDRDLKQKGKELERRALETESKIKEGMNFAVGEIHKCVINRLLEKREEISTTFAGLIDAMTALKNVVKSQGGEMTNVEADGAALDVDNELRRLIEERAKALQAIDVQIAEIGESVAEPLAMLNVEVEGHRVA